MSLLRPAYPAAGTGRRRPDHLLIGSNDTVLQLMGAMGRATNGKATKLLIPLLTGTMRELNLQTLQDP